MSLQVFSRRDAGSGEGDDAHPFGIFGTVIYYDCPRPIQLQTPSEARRKAENLSAAVLESWRTLREVVQRHEGTICRRWSNKSKGQKLKILLAAWPGMSLNHRPDFYAMTRESQEQRDAGTAFRAAYMWPHINQEDLSKPKILPLLLNARGRHFPSAFAAADLDAAAFGPAASNDLFPKVLPGYTMTLSSVTESNMDDYGKIVGWHSSPGTAGLCLSEREFEPGEGLLVLDVQERLYSFLVDCCKEILHDIPVDSWISDAFPIRPEPPKKSEVELTGFESLAVMAAEAPYRLPAKLHLGKIESLLAARTAAAEDRLWALREDPLFLRDQLLEAKEHLPDQLEHAEVESPTEDTLWVFAIGDVVRDAVLQLEVFSDLRRQAEELQALQIRYAQTISPQKDLPDEYLDALLSFVLCLESSVKSRLNHFQRSAAASQPLRRLFVDATPLEMMTTSTKRVIRPKAGAARTQAEDSLVRLLDFLSNNEKDPFITLVGVDEFERLVGSEPEVSRLMTSYSASCFGDLSILAQCLRQINLYHPWARTFPKLLEEHSGKASDLRRKYEEKSKAWLDVLGHLHVWNFLAAEKAAEPFRRRFPYPIEKRRTKENVAALREAEGSLDAFWDCIDRIIQKKAGNLDGTATKRVLSQGRALQRTPEWVEPLSSQQGGINPAGDPRDVIYKPPSPLYFGPEPAVASQTATGPSGRSQKIKTKGTARPRADTPTSGSTSPSTDAATPRTIPVDARALKVFRALFHNPDITSTPGEIAWNDFLHAMTSTGFMAQKLYGSVWQFQAVNPEAGKQKVIQFHEPHPKGKLQYWIARRYGRRLQRAYGWCGSTFVLREK